MALVSHSINTTRAQISQADENMTLPATLSLPLPLAPDESVSCPGPDQHPSPISASAPPYTKYELEVIGKNALTPPPPYTESDSGVTVNDFKTPPRTYASPPPSLRHGLYPNHDDDSSSLCVGASEGPGPLQPCDARRGNEPAGRDKLSLVLEHIPVYCTTTCTSVSKHLNFHVNFDNNVYRWRTTEGDIPIGIDLPSFESPEQELLVTKCLNIVLDKLNGKNIGPRFKLVEHPCHSAFIVTFEGHDPGRYASSFFPGSDPEYWQIRIYKLALTLNPAQEQFLKDTRRGDTKFAMSQALERNLTKILTHEMLHIIGLRHCVIDADEETEPYWRYPPKLSNKDNLDPLMKSALDWNDLSQSRLKRQTLREIRQIYDMQEGTEVSGMMANHRIRGVSWKDGPRKRKEIAKRIARCSTP